MKLKTFFKYIDRFGLDSKKWENTYWPWKWTWITAKQSSQKNIYKFFQSKYKIMCQLSASNLITDWLNHNRVTSKCQRLAHSTCDAFPERRSCHFTGRARANPRRKYPNACDRNYECFLRSIFEFRFCRTIMSVFTFLFLRFLVLLEFEFQMHSAIELQSGFFFIVWGLSIC